MALKRTIMNLKGRPLASLRRMFLFTVVIIVVTTGLFTEFRRVHRKISTVIRREELDSTVIDYVAESAKGLRASHPAVTTTPTTNTKHIEHQPGSIQKMTMSAMDKPIPMKSNPSFNVKKRFDERMEHALNICRRSNYSDIRSYQIWDALAFDRLKYCSIPKAGTTFLNRELKPTIRLINGSNALLNDHKRFFIVREPYSRIVSAFFSKVVGHPYWWTMTGKGIIKPFRQNASEDSVRCGNDATFPEYIKFVIQMHKPDTQRERRNPHFLRMMEVCNICVDVPDFIAKLETIKDDMEYILHSVYATGETNKSFVEVRNLARLFMGYLEKRNVTGCGSMCKLLGRFWYGQQATGLISENIQLPVRGQECDQMTGGKLADLAEYAYHRSLGQINKREHKKRVMTQLFQQVPMEDRKEIQRLLSLECELFGYDPQPDFVFPELYNSNG